MKTLLVAAALSLAFVGAAEARSHSSGGSYHRSGFDERGLTSHRHYVNVSGHVVHSPSHTASGGAPSGWSARCGDGSWSFSEHHRGTCSHHGGVTRWR